jgi:glyoxylase-like metal-dependent hydrolase (beta-lactamase superfamily II)
MCKILTIPCGNVNCYLLDCGSFAILIDTGRDKYKDYMLEKLNGYNITLIILTHGHMDHIGNTAFLSKHFNAKVAMHPDDYKLSKNNSINNIYATSFLGNFFRFFSLKDFKKITIENFEPDIFFSDGESLEEFGLDGKVTHIPGHTKGSIGILLNDNELIAGDTFMNIIYPTEALIVEDMDMFRKSVRKLSLLDLKLLYPGHGREIKSIKVTL